MTVNHVIAANVKKWMKEYDKSYQWLAEELGVSKSLVQHMLNGKRSFTSDRIFKLADVMEITVDQLIDEQREEKYALHLRGAITTREGQSALEHAIAACLKEDELFYIESVSKKGIKG